MNRSQFIRGALVAGALAFGAVAALYFVENLAYSFKLKKVAFLDVGMIAFGFVLRVVAGGLATGTRVSWYMLACTALLALFLGQFVHWPARALSITRSRSAWRIRTGTGRRRGLRPRGKREDGQAQQEENAHKCFHARIVGRRPEPAAAWFVTILYGSSRCNIPQRLVAKTAVS